MTRNKKASKQVVASKNMLEDLMKITTSFFSQSNSERQERSDRCWSSESSQMALKGLQRSPQCWRHTRNVSGRDVHKTVMGKEMPQSSDLFATETLKICPQSSRPLRWGPILRGLLRHAAVNQLLNTHGTMWSWPSLLKQMYIVSWTCCFFMYLLKAFFLTNLFHSSQSSIIG